MIIKYNSEELPILVTIDGKSYLIPEIAQKKENHVFYQVSVGMRWKVIINKKDTFLYHDMHNLKW
ncbi:MAG: hypothetical protein CVU98_06905 [Firmicutes bacterium HGW-Firmicutes-3]|nr:MAG: hypothetical protein CVV00_11585 [Firmicutes bacterium HGW-Firmicutes-5]PKM57276.1 MAG: hypothetical protein CVU98_06905 [Firmicutes bacterium HGW-Firmicutes-3]